MKLEEYLTKQMELKNQGSFKYSNIGSGLLGYTLAKIEETTFEDLLRSRIFSKYQMNNSTTDKSLVSNVLVAGLNPKGMVTPNWDETIVFAGAGGVYSSVGDLSKFAAAQFDSSNEVLALTRKPTYEGYLTGVEMGVRLGWLIKRGPGKESVWHNGASGGYTALMQIDIEKRNAGIILTNISGDSGARKNVDSLGDRLMDSLNAEITNG